MRSSTRSAYPHTSNGLIEPSSFVDPLAHRLAFSTSLPRVADTTISAHGSLAPGGLCCPAHPRYYDPIRQSRRLPPISQAHWLYDGSLPDDLVWAASETFPALGQRSFLACHRPYAERRNGDTPAVPPLPRLSATKQCVSSSIPPDPSFRRGFAYDAAAFTSCYGPQGCWPSWTGPTWSFLRPPRTYTPELARGWSPKPRVGYDYTALLGKNCGRTCTGWSTAVTGCTLCRKVDERYHILKRLSGKNTTNCR